MAFVNEYVSEEDAIKYDLDGINKLFRKNPQIRYQWTLDRERNIFLKWVEEGREELTGHVTFILWWDGQIITVYLVGSATGKLNEKTITTWRLRRIILPDELNVIREEVLSVLKEALTVYKVRGILVPVASHTAVFEF